MKLFEKRMQISWSILLIIALPVTALAVFAVVTDQLLIPGRPSMGGTRLILKKSDPDGFAFFLGSYIVVSTVALFFSFCQFRRGSWFNPI